MDETTKHLIELILSWWEEEQYRAIDFGDGDEANYYDRHEEPQFVKEALKMMDEGEL